MTLSFRQPQPSYNQGGYGGQQTSYGGQQGYQQQQTGGYGQQQAGYNAGGFQQNRPPPQNTSNVSPEILQWFNTVDVDRSGQVSSVELKQALVNADNTAFDDDTIKMLISLFDTERNGTINVQEFAGIYGYIKQWQGIFANFDRDRSGTMDQNELQAALAVGDLIWVANFYSEVLVLSKDVYCLAIRVQSRTQNHQYALAEIR